MRRSLATCLVFAAVQAAGAQSFSPEAPANVQMVVWRGCEDACQSFIRFFEDRELPVKVTVTDIAKDRAVLPGVQTAILEEGPDLVVTWGTSVSVGLLGTRAEYGAATALGTIPALFMIVADPVRSDLVESYEGSGRPTLTGVRNRVPEETQIALIQEYMRPKSVGVLVSPSEPNSVLNAERVQELAAEAGFEVVRRDYDVGKDGAPDPREIPRLMAALARSGVDAVYVGSSTFNLEHADAFTDAANAHGLPVFTAYAQMVQESGALMAVANAYSNVGKLAASQAAKILFEGVKPGDLPIASLDRFSVFINMNTAERLDLYPPIQLITIADTIRPDDHGPR